MIVLYRLTDSVVLKHETDLVEMFENGATKQELQTRANEEAGGEVTKEFSPLVFVIAWPVLIGILVWEMYDDHHR